MLKAIAAFEVEGMPRHHRILHVRQEIRAAGGDISVLKAVMDADVERNTLMEEEKKLITRLEGESGTKNGDMSGAAVKAKLEKLKNRSKETSGHDGDALFNADLKRLDGMYSLVNCINWFDDFRLSERIPANMNTSKNLCLLNQIHERNL